MPLHCGGTNDNGLYKCCVVDLLMSGKDGSMISLRRDVSPGHPRMLKIML